MIKISKYREVEIKCPNCNEKQNITVWDSLNTRLDPEAKKLLLEGKINILHCQKCAKDFLLPVPLLYHDEEKELAVYYYPPQCIDDEDFISKFQVESGWGVIHRAYEEYWKLSHDKWGDKVNYFRIPHIVFDLNDLLWYIKFRDKVFEKGKADSELARRINEWVEEIKTQKIEASDKDN